MKEKKIISFDYAIKFVLKQKTDMEIVSYFCSMILQECGYGPVEIIEPLDSETLIENDFQKKSIADYIAKDKDGKFFIIEVEGNRTRHFFHKSIFNASRLTIDTVEDSRYGDLKKIFHITMLFEPVDLISDVVYLSKTVANGTRNFEDLQAKDEYGKITRFSDLPPTHVFVSVANWCEGSQKGIDAMLKFFKTEEIDEDACSALKKMSSRLEIAKMTPDELSKYLYYKKEQVTQTYVQLTREIEIKEEAEAKGLAEGLEKGLEQGLERGKIEGKTEGIEIGERLKQIEIAKKMLFDKIDPKLIEKFTNLSIEEIEQIEKAQS